MTASTTQGQFMIADADSAAAVLQEIDRAPIKVAGGGTLQDAARSADHYFRLLQNKLRNDAELDNQDMADIALWSSYIKASQSAMEKMNTLTADLAKMVNMRA